MINTENVVHLADMDTQLIHLAMTFSAVEMNKQVVDFPAVERALGEKFVRYKPEILLTIKVGITLKSQQFFNLDTTYTFTY